MCKLRIIKGFVKTARSIEMKENKELILITLKVATDTCFLKIATPKYSLLLSFFNNVGFR